MRRHLRPLDFLGRIKVKLGIVILLAVVVAFVVNEVGINAGYTRDVRVAVAVALALVMVQLLARGMTKPLREMAAAAQTIAKGRYGLRVTATSRDEVGELARAFNAMAADLGEVDRQRRELVANVSHELRTPITALRAVLENVVDGVSEPDPATLGTALAQTERLGRLVAQLLDLSRLESGARLIEPENVELGPLCDQALREAVLARDGVTARCEVPAGLVVLADADLLAQVLANLLDNAVRHSPEGGVVVLAARPEGAGVRLRVTDQGPGIPEEDRGRAFERFSRLDAGRAADGGGAGLGLAITKEIVELHGGSIRVEDGVGCSIAVDLPERITMDTSPPGESLAPSPDPPDRTDAPVSRASAGSADLAPPPEPAVSADPAPPSGPVTPADPAASTGDPADPPGPATSADPAPGPAGDPGKPSGPVIPAAIPAAIPSPATRSPVTPSAAPLTFPELPVAAGPPPPPYGAPAEPALARIRRETGTENPPRDRQIPIRSWWGAVAGLFVGGFIGLCVGVLLGLAVGAVELRLGLTLGLLAPAIGAFIGTVIGATTAPSGIWSGYQPVEQGVEHGTEQRAAEPVPPRAAVPVPGKQAPESGGEGAGAEEETPVAGARVRAGGPAPGVAGTVPGTGEPAGVYRTPPAHRSAPAGHGGYGGPPGGYVAPSLLPRPELPDTPRWLLAACAAVGLLAAVVLPYSSVGLGFVLVAGAMGAAALPVVRGRLTLWSAGMGAIAYGLVVVAIFRDADWLVGLLLLAAFVMAALALSGAGRGWLGVLRGGISVLLGLLPVPWFLAAPLKGMPIRRRLVPSLIGAGLTVVLVAIFGALFASADAVFAKAVERVFTGQDWAESLPLRIVVFVVFAAVVASSVLVGLRPVAEPKGPDLRLRVGRGLWMIPLIALNLLFVTFVAMQLTALFGSARWLVAATDLTYAEYARSGFFQLVVVSVFVLAIVALASGAVELEGRDRWLMAGLLGLLCGLTVVILVSAMYRLDLYVDAYGYTRLRASVGAAIWWLGGIFALVLVAGAVRLTRRAAGWLPRSVVVMTGAGLLAFAIWNPDLRVAESQLSVRGVDRLDQAYLGDLGAEAVPALDRLPEPARGCVLRAVIQANRLDRADPWNGWNLAREQARELLAERPAPDGGACEEPYRVGLIQD
ncbi:DUF4173 domain-containing protein [Planomonospora sp. ID67723]|uniref:DUF4153 domain-containing protein n=1 Tax=Planomonospora sp. ID67723 TaxID=2738134 RepID=UPI0018C3CCF5|nr:DUF4153 domain-containing protein [Planomonospora sp. ID67723]MBG0828186.1 DUF4173 domain-containing protein [Planomonospora sp. ID67723]